MNPQQAPAFIDFEASSLDLVASYPIEVGICLPDGSLHSWLIKPHVLWLDWSEKAQQIHSIPRSRLIEEGRDISDVVAELNKLLSGPVYCDAWTFDSFWLHRLFRTAGCKPGFFLESVSMLLTPHQINLWAQTRRDVIDSLSIPTHRAANDARILRETWQRLSSGTSALRSSHSL